MLVGVCIACEVAALAFLLQFRIAFARIAEKGNFQPSLSFVRRREGIKRLQPNSAIALIFIVFPL